MREKKEGVTEALRSRLRNSEGGKKGEVKGGEAGGGEVEGAGREGGVPPQDKLSSYK